MTRLAAAYLTNTLTLPRNSEVGNQPCRTNSQIFGSGSSVGNAFDTYRGPTAKLPAIRCQPPRYPDTPHFSFNNQMPLSISPPSKPILITAEPLTASAFSPFGTAISNPSDASLAQVANQGSAFKYVDISPFHDFYAQAPSRVNGKASVNMFVCSPRMLEEGKNGKGESSKVIKVGILERHPFTTQTFCPLGLSASSDTKFLVIVAPSLPLSEKDIGLAVPRSSNSTGAKLPGRGLPDLTKLKAFLANGSQAVTYGAGTWHAPMVVLGDKEVAFVVSQFVNGVGEEDCQEVVWEGDVRVSVPQLTVKVKREEGKEGPKEEGKEGNFGLWEKKSAIEGVVTDRLGEEGKKAIHGDKSGKSKL